MLDAANLGSEQQGEFAPYLLSSISAVVVGGTSLFGGQGGIGNTVKCQGSGAGRATRPAVRGW